MQEYTYHLLSRENLKDLNLLFEAAFGARPRENKIEWKYFSNPSGNAILAGAFHNGTLVGSGAMIPEKFKVLENEVTVYKCTDLMTHPRHQRKGISKQVNALLNEEVNKQNPPFSYTLCSTVSTKSFVRNKWTFIEEVTNLFKPYRMLKIQSLFSKKSTDIVECYNGIDDHLDSYAFHKDTSKISLDKSVEFLKWRTQNPDFEYHLICVYTKKKELKGYLIYSTNSNNLLNVLDIDAIGQDDHTINQLIRCAENKVVEMKHKGIVIMAVKNTSFYARIKHKYYLRNPFKSGPLQTVLDFDINQLNNCPSEINSLSLWDIKGINYDDV
jgi:hypothetical protein